MCGIFGVTRVGGICQQDRLAFDRLSAELRHRGPDGSARIERPGVVMGMHRLSIIDVERGWQPFWSAEGAVGVLANGEIYNAPELATDLQGRGFRLNSHSDIEVLPHLFEEYGLGYVDHLRGMFAISLLDTPKQRLVLTRDRLGEKPLFYAHSEGAFWFSSEMSALVRAGIVPAELDRDQLRPYLTYGFVPEPHTVLTGVSRVPAGHHVIVHLESGDTEIVRYWAPLDHLDAKPLSKEELEHEVRTAVTLSTRSDVPVAVALSGGIDSSLVGALAQEARGDIHAISVGYAGQSAHDETAMAAEFSRRLGMPFHRVELSAERIGRGFAAMCRSRDEPIADIAGPGYDSLAAAARELGFPVLLNGQGGDELFWGYPWVFRLARQAHCMSVGVRNPRLDPLPRQVGPLAQWLDDRGGLRSRRVLRMCRPSVGSEVRVPLYRLQPGHSLIERQIDSLLPGTLPDGFLDYRSVEPSRYWALFGVGIVETYLRSNGLAQTDRLTMAHSVEGRTPLVDYRVAEMALSMMANVDHLQQSPKSFLKGLASRILPAEVLARPKMGFTPPIREWAKRIWVENHEAPADPILARLDLFDRAGLTSRLRSPVSRSGRVDQVALRLMTLELWMDGLIHP